MQENRQPFKHDLVQEREKKTRKPDVVLFTSKLTIQHVIPVNRQLH